MAGTKSRRGERHRFATAEQVLAFVEQAGFPAVRFGLWLRCLAPWRQLRRLFR